MGRIGFLWETFGQSVPPHNNMKKYLLAAAALLTFATACNQSDDDLAPAATNKWVVGAAAYNVSVIDTNGVGYTAVNQPSGNAIVIAFPNGIPTQSADFRVSDSAQEGVATVLANDAASNGGYLVRSGTLKVTVANGKRIMSLAPSPARYVGMTVRPDQQVALSIEK